MEMEVEKSFDKEPVVGVDEKLKEGEERLLGGDLEGAEKCFQEMLAIDPRHPSAHSGLGIVAYRKGDFKKAERAFQLAVEVDPLYAAAWNNLGAVLIARQRYSEAKVALEKALFLQPDLEDAVNQLLWLEEKIFNPGGNYRSEHYPSISLCMIVKNEEKNLPRALSSVRDIVDEIVVVDTGSSDRTVEIARSFGAKVHFFEWCDDFAAARNESLKYATKDWILVMDADEEIQEEDLKKLKLILRITDYAGFEIMIKSNCSVPGKEAINYMSRVFRNHPSIRFESKIHETTSSAIIKMGGKLGRLKNVVIYHHGYGRLVRSFKKANERNLKILLEEYRRNPEDLKVLYYLGITYLGQGKLEEAKGYLTKVFNCSRERGIKGLLVLACVGLAQVHLAQNNFEEAIGYLEGAIAVDKHFPDAYYWLGRVFYRTGNYKESLESFKQVFQVDHKKSISPFAFAFVDPVDAYFRMADCAYRLEDEETAKKYSSLLSELVRDNPDGLSSLGKAMIDAGCFGEAEECFRAALSLNPLHPEARTCLFSLLLQQGKKEEAKECLREIGRNL